MIKPETIFVETPYYLFVKPTRYILNDKFQSSHDSGIDMNYPFVILTGYILSDRFQGYHDSDIDV